MERDIEYENNNIAYDEQYSEEAGGGIKCKNYELCEAVLPKWWFECKGHYLCINCHMMFGTWKNEEYGIYKTGKGILEISDNLECPICFEINRGISQPNCDHTLCIECFKRCYYGKEFIYPDFPYPDIEDEYDEDQENPKWNIDYPLIFSYNVEWNRIDNDRQNKYESEKYLRKCPLCRK